MRDIINLNSPLPFPDEVRAQIFQHLTLDCPTKIIRLSRQHYHSLIPRIYQNIVIISQNVEKLLYGSSIFKGVKQDHQAVPDIRKKDDEKRKLDCFAYTETITFQDIKSFDLGNYLREPLEPIINPGITLMEKRIKFLRDRGMSNGPSQLWKYKINRMISEEIIFPNLKQINVSKSCFILNSPPTHDQSEDICIEEEELDKLEKQFMKIKDLFRILPIKKDIYLDMLDSDIPVKRLIKLFEVIFTTFNPSTMVIRSSHTLMPMSLPYIHHITNVKLYLEMDAPNLMDISEDEKEEIISDFRGFEWRTLTSSGARRETKERPIEVYLKNQNLLDVLEEISLLNDKNDEDKKIIKLFKWDKEEDWLK